MFSLSNDMIALGLFTSIYSAIQARNGLQQSLSVLNVYQENGAPDGSFPGVLALLDIFVNIVMPIIVVFAGFLVVAVQDNYIDGVLNCAALLCKCTKCMTVFVIDILFALGFSCRQLTVGSAMNSYTGN